MKIFRNTAWMFALAIALTVIAGPQVATAQSEQGMEHGRGHNKDRRNGQDSDFTQNPNYQRGMSQGQNDGRRNRSSQNRANLSNDLDRRAYQAGYDKGYQDGHAE